MIFSIHFKASKDHIVIIPFQVAIYDKPFLIKIQDYH